MRSLIAIILFAMLSIQCECKGGGRGGGGRSSGGRSSSSRSSSSSHSSSSGGWFSWGRSSSSPASSPSHHSSAPPAYPGLASRPGSSHPPAYSQSFNYPPSYSSSYVRPAPYGTQFGSSGLRTNTYISNNYYGGYGSNAYGSSGSYSPFLTHSLFYNSGVHRGHYAGGSSYSRNSWDNDDDSRWRQTTKAPYFENKVPGSEDYLPAAAVVGAATAFGLSTLLPLNVPVNKPLMYCNDTDIAQAMIQYGENVYTCDNTTFEVICDSNDVVNSNSTDCVNEKLDCDLPEIDGASNTSIYCENATLFSRSALVCNSTKERRSGSTLTKTVLECYEGSLPIAMAGFVPTIESWTTTEKSLSFSANVHIFLLHLIGEEQVLQKKDKNTWVPNALEITSTTTEQTNAESIESSTSTPPTTTKTSSTFAMKIPKFGNGSETIENSELTGIELLAMEHFKAKHGHYPLYVEELPPDSSAGRSKADTSKHYFDDILSQINEDQNSLD